MLANRFPSQVLEYQQPSHRFFPRERPAFRSLSARIRHHACIATPGRHNSVNAITAEYRYSNSPSRPLLLVQPFHLMMAAAQNLPHPWSAATPLCTSIISAKSSYAVAFPPHGTTHKLSNPTGESQNAYAKYSALSPQHAAAPYPPAFSALNKASPHHYPPSAFSLLSYLRTCSQRRQSPSLYPKRFA